MNVLRRSLATVAVAAVAASLGVPAAAADPISSADLGDAVAQYQLHQQPQSLKVVVLLKNQPAQPSKSAEAATKKQQNDLLDSWKSKYGLKVDRQFGYLLNGFSATISSDKLLAFSSEPQVASVRKERVFETTDLDSATSEATQAAASASAATSTAAPATAQPAQYNGRVMEGVPTAISATGADGTGTVISIVDTGIDVTHQDMRLDKNVCAASKLTPDTAHGFTCKVPYGYNYADENYNVLDTTGVEHGQHVAGIAAANGAEGSDAPDFAATGRIDGAAPNAQLLAMKVFSNDGSGGASDSDIIAAIEDSVKLGADVINMSLGSLNGQNETSDGTYRAIEKAREAGVLVVISAGNEGTNFSLSGETDDYYGRLDDATLGSPGSQGHALTVASIDNNTQVVSVGYQKVDGTESSFAYSPATGTPDGKEYPLVDVGLSRAEDYADGEDLTGKYALIERGGNTFEEKYHNAVDHGAAGIIVFNSAAGGDTYLSMGGIDWYQGVSASVYRSTGLALREALAGGADVTVRITTDQQAVPYMNGLHPSSFTSWGPTPTLDFEPDVAGVGGSVYSTLNGNSYGTMSGTSMAAPNVSGLSALIIDALKEREPSLTGAALLDRVQTLLQNTAAIPTNDAGVPYAPRQVGAGLGQVDKALATPVFATVNGEAEVALREVNGPASFQVTLTNTSDADVTYTVPAQQVINETNTAGEDTTTFVSKETLTAASSTVTVPAHGTATVDFTLTPDTSASHYVEGWARFTADGQPDLNVPYLGFVGDWNAEPIVAPQGEELAPGINSTETTLVTSYSGYTIPTHALGKISGNADDEFWLSPNGDGDMDVVAPALALLRNAAEAKYEVLDASGKVVRTVGYEQGLTRHELIDLLAVDPSKDMSYLASDYAFDGITWDQSKGKYVTVPDGRYTLRVSTRLGENFPWQNTDFSFGVDNEAPQIAFNSLTDGVLTFTVTDTVSGIAAAPSVAAADGSDLDVTDNGDGTYSVNVADTVPYVTVSVLDRGFSLGTATYVVASGQLVVSDADTLNRTVIGPKSLGVSDGALQLSGYVSADVTRVEVNATAADLSDGRFHASVPLTEGTNTIRVVAFNADGDVVAANTVSPVYDSQPPTVTVDGLENGYIAPAADGSVTISGTVTDERAGAKPTVTVDGTAAEVGADGAFTATVTPKAGAASLAVVASDGPNTTSVAVPLVAPDAVGQPWQGPTFTNTAGGDSYSYTFVPVDSSDYKDGVWTIRGEGADQTTRIVFTPTVSAAGGTLSSPAPIEATINKDGTFSAPLPVGTGFNDFRLEIYDLDGTKQVDNQFTVYADMVAPTVHFTEPTLTGGVLYASSPHVTFAGTAEDDGWGYTLKLNDSTVLQPYSWTGLGPESNRAEFSTDLTVATGDTLSVVFGDAMGNTLTGRIPVVVDSDAPNVAVTAGDAAVSDGDVVRDGATLTTTATDPYLTGLAVSVVGPDGYTFTDNQSTDLAGAAQNVEDVLAGAGDAADVTGDGSAGGTTAGNAGGTEAAVAEPLHSEFATKDLAAGEYTLTATGTDAAGNTTSHAVTFHVDAAPTISGPDTVDLTVDRAALGDQDALAAQVLGHFTVDDDAPVASDPANPGKGETTLTLAPGTVLTEGDNQVTIVVTQADGYRVEKTVTVTVKVNAPAGGSTGGSGSGSESGSQGGAAGVPAGSRILLSNNWTSQLASIGTVYGRPGETLYVGDWNGDGKDSFAVRRGNTFLVTNARSGQAQTTFSFGRPGDEVLVGDWDGDGKDSFAVRRGNTVYYANGLHGGQADGSVAYGRTSDQVLVGDWNGNGRDELAVRRGNTFLLQGTLRTTAAVRAFAYGHVDDAAISGDWDGNGADSIGVIRGRQWHVKNSLSGGQADRILVFGLNSDAHYVGDWDGNGTDTPGVAR